MVFLVIAIILGLIPAAIAQHKGRSFMGWWFYGAALWIVALPHALMMKARVPQGMKKCPSCAEAVKEEAVKCKHCGEVLNKNSAPQLLECPKCHKTYDASWKVCLNCRTSLVSL